MTQMPDAARDLMTTVFGPLIATDLADLMGEVIIGVDVDAATFGEFAETACRQLVSSAVINGLNAMPMGWTASEAKGGRISVNVIGRRLTQAKAA